MTSTGLAEGDPVQVDHDAVMAVLDAWGFDADTATAYWIAHAEEAVKVLTRLLLERGADDGVTEAMAEYRSQTSPSRFQ